MLIPLSCPDNDVSEWAVVELQGRIEPLHEIDLQQALQVGTMHLSPTSNQVVQLQIGYHILEGQRVPLKKPMAILETIKDSDQGDSSATHCKVVGILRHKYLFKTRPKALITKPIGR